MMKKITLWILVFGSLQSLISDDIQNKMQFNWLNDLETLVRLDTQRDNTLQGRDINNNGIRDDVENYVKQKYKNDPFQKGIFLKAAQKIQTILTLPKDATPQTHWILDRQLLSYYTCRDYILYRQNEKNIEKEMLSKTIFKGKVLNTKERLTAYIEHKKKIPINFDDLSKDELKREKENCLSMYQAFVDKESPNSISLNTK